MSASTEIVRTDGAHALLTPDEQVEADRQVATALVRLVEDARLAKTIQGRKYLTAEAWSVGDRILGLSVYIDDPEPFTDSTGAKGYRARAHVRDREGNPIASATAICTRSEKRWSTADEYALMSMAQTRANGKAHRTGLSAIAVMAGYEATPAEEMPESAAPTMSKSEMYRREAGANQPEPKASAEQRRAIVAAAKAANLSPGDTKDIIEQVTGARTGTQDVPAARVGDLLRAIELAHAAEVVPDAELDFGAE